MLISPMASLALKAFNKERNYGQLHTIRSHHLNKICEIVLSFNRYSKPSNWYAKLSNTALKLIEIESAYAALAEQAKLDGIFNNK